MNYRLPICFCFRTWRCYSNSHRKTFYEILEVKQKSSRREIKAAYIRLSKELHPDKNPRNPESHIKFVLVNQAYSVLSNPTERALYDQHLATGFLDRTNRNEDESEENYKSTAWRDETLWSMRDRSQDKYYYGRDYYGIKGLKRVENKYIALGCLIVMIVGLIGHYFAFRYGEGLTTEYMNAKDKRNSDIYLEVRRRAEEFGMDEQAERIQREIEESQNNRSRRSD